uniref:RanBP2-type domain-containing protein n=1 Tax=Salix viminalis TaxID=40686 RepID=A0A6N2NHX6_SALVM
MVTGYAIVASTITLHVHSAKSAMLLCHQVCFNFFFRHITIINYAETPRSIFFNLLCLKGKGKHMMNVSCCDLFILSFDSSFLTQHSGNKAIGISRIFPGLGEQKIKFWKYGQPQSYPSFNHMAGTIGDQSSGVHVSYPTYSTELAPNWQAPVQIPLQLTTPALLGKGAKQWRNGDWMCANCNNHNYASRAQCNRCKTQRDVVAQPVNVV